MDTLQNLWQLFLHFDQYLDVLIPRFGWATYGLAAFVIFAEVGLVVTGFLPGDSLLFAMGALSARGTLHLPVMLPLLCVAAFLGNIQDKHIDQQLAGRYPDLHPKVVAVEKASVFGSYRPLDQDKVSVLADADKGRIQEITAEAKKSALATVAVFPTIMLICYIILLFYFKTHGGYRVVELEELKS